MGPINVFLLKEWQSQNVRRGNELIGHLVLSCQFVHKETESYKRFVQWHYFW